MFFHPYVCPSVLDPLAKSVLEVLRCPKREHMGVKDNSKRVLDGSKREGMNVHLSKDIDFIEKAIDCSKT
jgi:hypothetical protein